MDKDERLLHSLGFEFSAGSERPAVVKQVKEVLNLHASGRVQVQDTLCAVLLSEGAMQELSSAGMVVPLPGESELPVQGLPVYLDEGVDLQRAEFVRLGGLDSFLRLVFTGSKPLEALTLVRSGYRTFDDSHLDVKPDFFRPVGVLLLLPEPEGLRFTEAQRHELRLSANAYVASGLLSILDQGEDWPSLDGMVPIMQGAIKASLLPKEVGVELPAPRRQQQKGRPSKHHRGGRPSASSLRQRNSKLKRKP